MTRAFSPTVLRNLIELLESRAKEQKYIGDLSDLGNEIGIIVGGLYPNISEEEISSFISGFEHGSSLTNGTH
jgi:hypothetical protein